MGGYCEKSAENITQTEDKTDLIQSENKTSKISIDNEIKRIEINVDIENNNGNNKIISGSLIDKWKNQKIKKNKQIIRIKDILSEPEIDEQNIGIEKEGFEKEIYLFDSLKHLEFKYNKDPLDMDELEEIKTEKSNDSDSHDIVYSLENFYKSEIIIMAKLEKRFCINFPEKFEINNLHELSNQRIAVYDYYSKKLQIYSLKTGKYMTEIESEIINDITESKNKDLIICSSKKIYFYKLLPNKHYELYQNIDESKQGTFKKTNSDVEEYFNLYSVYELMNGNLISCSSNGIKIYKKNLDNSYNLSFIKQIDSPIRNVIEIKNNLLFLLGHKSLGEYNLKIYKYDIEKNELTLLNNSSVYDIERNKRFLLNFSYVIINNHLIIRYGFNLDIYDITQDGKLIYDIKIDNSKNIPFEEIMCNFDENKIVVRTYKGIYKILRYNDKSFTGFEIFPFAHKFTKGIIKLRDNNFVIYSKNKIILLKNLEN